MTSALRQLAYGISSDATDEYITLRDTNARHNLKSFCSAIVSLYSGVYKRRPTEDDIRAIQKVNSERSYRIK
jgi:hypothetical protein